jgi:selenocysteine lyase/cysteine desulfurase
MLTQKGQLFPDALQIAIKDKFFHVDVDIDGKERLFMDNAGGSFRLKAAVEKLAQIDAIPDCPERVHQRALYLQRIQEQGERDIKIILNTDEGSIYASLTASGAMFDMVRAIAENVPGDNMVTTVLEHPSSFDAMQFYAGRTQRELRVARSNPETGGVDIDEIIRLIDKNTCLLSVMHASNISGAKFDIEQIVHRARQIKPDLFIIVDAVQHAPHAIIDLKKYPVDGINFAPYKFFGCRGSGISWLSPRAAAFPHHKLAGKPEQAWELGSPAPAQFAVLTEIVDYVCWLGAHFRQADDRREQFCIGMEAIALHERALLAALLEGVDGATGLRNISGVRTFLDHDDLAQRELILAMSIDGLSPTEAVREYEKRGVIVYERIASSIYSKRMLESFGLVGAIRVSPLHCQSLQDIRKFLQITAEIAENFS